MEPLTNELTCTVCFDKYDEKYISTCMNCLESGNMCHYCELNWVIHKNNPKLCTVCNRNSRENISNKSSLYYIYREFPNIQNQLIINDTNITRLNNDFDCNNYACYRYLIICCCPIISFFSLIIMLTVIVETTKNKK